VPVVLVSAVGAGGYAGPLWFKAVIEAARRDHPAAAVSALLDCGAEAGTALGALRAGIRHVRFAGDDAARAPLAAIARSLGAVLESAENEVAAPALDLLDAHDPEALCRAYLAGNEARR
jgi:hypothetical protein